MNEKSLQEVIYEIENFLGENYSFRRNLLSGKTEVQEIGEGKEPSEWCILTEEVFNSILLKMMKEDVGGKSPKQHTLEIINSEATVAYDPIKEYLEHLPLWDGRNHVAELFNRIPGLTSEQLSWCCTWLRSAVAHWMGIDMLHGNEAVPVLIGAQGCGKTTFATRLLPVELRAYFLDHINFGNKFDTDMALTHNLLVNIDEFANMGPSQQGKLKQTLSKVKVNGRPIFGRSQDDRRRYASFLATTNDEHPLCDTTGSRRYICLQIPKGKLIDNTEAINYEQLYAQLLYEINEKQTPYWFTNDEVIRIQQANLPFFKQDDLEDMIKGCFRIPNDEEEGKWMLCKEVYEKLQERYPYFVGDQSIKIKIGNTLKFMGCSSQHTRQGQMYQLIPKEAA
ncbi:MAG: helicase [Bacteroidaceae bacterium]|jgi:predicted P-loop ATPase|nr:helicase [Bacteroidaceae bacterium]